ncbi:ROK family protein [Nocardioides sp.]|uniref:ROK family protein n=1 Tax=Nocardioides sp. TaxID=35761 RepID=UPI002C2D6CA6|nr:ROK family protein [Nocardioides sp.]HSX68821.1 ROK family protein [Nocardioides sp.]
MSEPVWVGVDVGGTKVLAAVVGDDGTVADTARRTTPGRRVDARMVEDALTEAVLAAADGRPLAGVGVAAAGFVDAAGERVRFAPHLPWLDEPVRSRLAERWGVPVRLENDATAAAYGELVLGAARGYSDVVTVNLGTGLGGGIVIGGRLYRGHNGMAGEFGHMQVVPDGLACACGSRGCWEQYCSGSALERYARSRDADLLNGRMVTAAADEGDLEARAAFAELGHWLGVGLANLVAAFDPEVVVVGGGVSEAGDRLLEPARVALGRSLVGAGHRDIPAIVAAQLGNTAGLVGAACLIRDEQAA